MKDIKGYEGLYAVTEDGKVFGYKRGRYLIPQTTDGKYFRVKLSKNGKTKTYLIHRLVAEAFIDNPDNKPCINHIDENGLNNHVSNLEWCTYKENNNHGNHNKKIAEAAKKSVMCVETGEIYSSLGEAADAFNVAISGICASCKNPNRSVLGKHFVYVNNDEDINKALENSFNNLESALNSYYSLLSLGA